MLTDRMIAQLHLAGFIHAAQLFAGNPVEILPADRTDAFEHIYHAVDRRHPDPCILHGCLIINFLTAGTFLFQNNVQQRQPLFCDPASLLPQAAEDLLFLHFCLFITDVLCLIHPVYVSHSLQPPPENPRFLWGTVYSVAMASSAVFAVAATLNGLSCFFIFYHTADCQTDNRHQNKSYYNCSHFSTSMASAISHCSLKQQSIRFL